MYFLSHVFLYIYIFYINLQQIYVIYYNKTQFNIIIRCNFANGVSVISKTLICISHQISQICINILYRVFAHYFAQIHSSPVVQKMCSTKIV